MAATNYIGISTSATTSTSVTRDMINFAKALRHAIDRGNALNESLTQAALDGAPALAAVLGLSDDNAAEVQTLLDDAMTELNADTAVAEFMARVT